MASGDAYDYGPAVHPARLDCRGHRLCGSLAVHDDATLEPVARGLPLREHLCPSSPRVHLPREGNDLGGTHVYPIDKRLRHRPSPLTFRPAARPATDNHPLRGTEVEDPGLRMLAHDPLQSPRLLGFYGTRENHAAALHGCLDAARAGLVQRVEPDTIALEYLREAHDLP